MVDSANRVGSTRCVSRANVVARDKSATQILARNSRKARISAGRASSIQARCPDKVTRLPALVGAVVDWPELCGKRRWASGCPNDEPRVKRMTRQAMPITVEIDGARFAGFYTVESSMLTVWHAILGSRTRSLCESHRPADADAETFLLEFYAASRPILASPALGQR